MKLNTHATQVALACAIYIGAFATANAAPLSLSQIPAGAGGREPAPNVILSIDDSGSMGEQLGGGVSGTKVSLLKQSLKAQFGTGANGTGKIPDGRIRLAWQAMWNNGGASGAGSLTPGNTNTIRPFVNVSGGAQHRTNFNTFVDSITASNGTPSLRMMRQVHNYARTPAGLHSPWANNPGVGTAQDPATYLSCRRTYHIFLTDGAYNNGSISNDNIGATGDSFTRTLPADTTGSSQTYSVTSNQTRVYRDEFGDKQFTTSNNAFTATFADLAFRSWATDMQDGSNSTASMVNNVRPLIRKGGNEWYATARCPAPPTAAPSDCVATQEYWNPKNNPATWQHVSLYTIGFGTGAVNWPYRKSDGTYTASTASATDVNGRTTPLDWDANNTAKDTYAGDLPRIIQGELVWGDPQANQPTATPDIRTMELWHGAINGRGKYFPVTTADGLTAAFDDILNTVIGDTATSLVSIATSSSYLRSGLFAYIAGFDATRYSGTLSARPIDPQTGAIQESVTWNAAAALDALNSTQLGARDIASYRSDTGTGFAWKTLSNLPTTQQTAMKRNSAGTVESDTRGQERIDYIRGDRTNEVAAGGRYRDRNSRLGDIVNSNIWYTGKPANGYSENNYANFASTGSPSDGKYGSRTPMVYIGANDGMLHGFSATDGSEMLAYIPEAIANTSLRRLTDTGYVHEYYVDGTPFTGDAYISNLSKWRTYLVATLGAGGKGYAILDVTDPTTFANIGSTNLTTANAAAASLVLMDNTTTTDTDIGHIVSPPVMDDAIANKSRQIVKLNNNRWAVVMGNGVNSTNEAPVLLIQYLDGSKELQKISPCTLTGSPLSATGTCSFKGSNGMSTPNLIDLNGDGKVDIAYAGDIQGNLWKFDLTSTTASNWRTSFSNQPLFIARRSGVNQPITTAPFWMQHPNGGIMVAFGTGQNLTDADQTSTAVQSIYAVWDKSTFTAGATVTLTDSTVVNTVASPGFSSTLVQQTYSATPIVSGVNYYEQSANTVNWADKRGWYLDWPITGQRVLTNIRAFTGQKILVQTTVPKQGTSGEVETCSPSATAERSFQSVFNMFSGAPPQQPPFSFTDTTINAANITMIEGQAGDTTLIRTDTKLKLLSSNCPAGQVCNARDFLPGDALGLRANWRQILK